MTFPKPLIPGESIKTFVLLLTISFVLFFYRLADRDLWSSHEARAAQDAASILDEGNWGLPRLFDRHAELQKPPLYYWMVAAFGWLRGGVDAWAVRLPAALAATGCVLGLYCFGWMLGRPKAGLLAALVLATALHFTWLARVGRIDMPLTFTVTLCLTGFYLGKTARDSGAIFGSIGYFALAYAAAGAAVLLKGPIGLALPVSVIGIFLVTERSWANGFERGNPLRWLREHGIWWGLPLFLALALPWFFWANAETHGQLWQIFFVKHNLERGLGSGTLAAHPWWFYGPQLFLDALPWSLFLPGALFLFFKRDYRRADALARFGLIWSLAITCLLSLSKFKRADYLLPAFPGLALFLGCCAERWYASTARKRVAQFGFGVIVLGSLLGWSVYVNCSLVAQDTRLEWRSFAAEIRKRAPAPQLVIFFRAEAHALAFHVGRPIDTILEWENLDVWAGRPETYYVVMPPDCAADWPSQLVHGRLEEVLRSDVGSEGSQQRPLVLMRTCPGTSRSPL